MNTPGWVDWAYYILTEYEWDRSVFRSTDEISNSRYMTQVEEISSKLNLKFDDTTLLNYMNYMHHAMNTEKN